MLEEARGVRHGSKVEHTNRTGQPRSRPFGAKGYGRGKRHEAKGVPVELGMQEATASAKWPGFYRRRTLRVMAREAESFGY